MRELIYRRDHGLCVQCRSKDIIKIGDVVDHIIPIRMDWSKRLEPTNLQTLCHACHNKKTKEDEKKNKNNSKEKMNTPHHKKQVMAPWRPPPSFPCKSSFYSIKGVQPREVVLIGRKAKPIHLHLLEGNTNRLTKDEIEQRLKAEKQLQAKRTR